MLKITILAVGTVKEKYMKDAIADYVKRMTGNYNVNFLEAPEGRSIEAEGESLIRLIPKDSHVCVLDLKGKMLTSPELAEFISSETVYGTSHFTFIIGGSDGLSGEVIKRAKTSICLSKMTFPHQMVRLILCEQLYRAMKINNGERYHK